LQSSCGVRAPMKALESGKNTHSSGLRLGPGNAHRHIWPQIVSLDMFGPEESEENLGLSRLGRRLCATLQPANIIGLREGYRQIQANSLPEAWASANPIAVLCHVVQTAMSFCASAILLRISVWHQSTTIGTNQRPYCNVRFPQCVRNKCFFLFSDTCARPLCTLANTNRRTTPKHFTNQWTQQLTSFPTVKVWPRLKHLTGRT